MSNLYALFLVDDVSTADRADKIARRIASIAAAKPVNVVSRSSEHASKRQEQRIGVFRHGRLTVAGGAKFDCIIVDVSENGARVELDGASGLPDCVLLKVLMTGEIKRARVVWKRANAVGLSFLTERKTAFSNARPRR